MSIELDCDEIYGLSYELPPTASKERWNGRDIEAHTKSLEIEFTFYLPPQSEASLLDRQIEQLIDEMFEDPKIVDEILAKAGYAFDTSTMTVEQVKSLKAYLKSAGREALKGCKKLGKKIEKGAKKTTDFGKKAFRKTTDFVKDHKTECIIVVAAVVAAAVGAAVGDAILAGAAKKEDDESPAPKDPAVAASSPPPSDDETLAINSSFASAPQNFQKDLTPLKSTFSSYLDTTQYAAPVISQPEKSTSYKVEGHRQKGKCITYINGMNNAFEEALANAEYIRKLSSNSAVEGIYNRTNGVLKDILEIGLLNYFGKSPGTQELLIQKWTEFCEDNKHNPSAKCLHFCHSQGALHTKNALMKLPQEIRDRIIVVAIAPATVIPRELCYQSFNYASKSDIVPLGEEAHALFRSRYFDEDDRLELIKTIYANKGELILLNPHEEAIGSDHSFQSPTFTHVIETHCKSFFNERENIE